MNERIEELIVSYLHRGTTPEQEQELFQACSNDPGIAAQLRRHLSLSLSLRQLRDTTEVPLELRNSLLSRINALQPEPEPAPVARPSFGVRSGIFQWRHVFGTALAGAALAALAFVAFQPDPGTVTTASNAVVHDTVRVVDTRTVTEIREVPQVRLVYVDRKVAKPGVDVAPEAGTLAETNPPPTTVQPGESLTTPIVVQPATQEPINLTLDTRPPEQESFIHQLSVMLASLERVDLSRADRVRD